MTWSDTHGFLGKPEDKTTGLHHVGAREYDPTTGRFLSVDPLLDLTDPQSLLAYAYANNNPASLSDPNGTCALMEGESSCSGGKTKTPPPPPPPGNPGDQGDDGDSEGDTDNSSGGSDHREHGFLGRSGHLFGVVKGFGKTAVSQVASIIPAAKQQLSSDLSCVADQSPYACLQVLRQFDLSGQIAQGIVASGDGVISDVRGGRPGQAVGAGVLYGVEIFGLRKVPVAGENIGLRIAARKAARDAALLDAKYLPGLSADSPKPLLRGSTGRIKPETMQEQMAMREVRNNPSGVPIPRIVLVGRVIN
ncbi:RHS repeat-associated core domain-containing protein [Kribbella qitaiheensis]|uniref:RHS repeat-associated core domain-containing protein n=1 Tax=Kribbella qitaiheensis TaxID=1544730 RepID=UPI0019D51194|nr:RHS repeat-associated core domain-containing protein [Kribbella qitaiheensis]